MYEMIFYGNCTYTRDGDTLTLTRSTSGVNYPVYQAYHEGKNVGLYVDMLSGNEITKIDFTREGDLG